MDRLARFIVQKSKVILALTALTTLIMSAMLFRLSLNADITSFLVDGNERGAAYAALLEKYDAADPVMVLAKREGGFKDRAGVLALFDLVTELQAVEGVASVSSILPPKNPRTSLPITRVDLERAPDFMLATLLAGPTADLMLKGERALVVVNPGADPIVVAGRLLELGRDDLVFAGNPMIYAELIDMLGWFLLGIPPVVIFLLLLVFTVQIGHPKLAALSILPAGIGSVWTFGLVCALGFEIDIIGVIVPIFVIVMGSADGLHFVTHLQSAEETDVEERTARALREVGVPMILTTVSTAAGFLSFLFTDVQPLRQLGVFVAIGIGFAGLVSFFTLPALLSRIEIPAGHPRAIGKALTKGIKRAAKTRVIGLVVVVGLLSFAAAFAPGLQVSSDQLFVFKSDHKARAAFREMSEVFGGATPLVGELVVDPTRPLAEQLPELARAQKQLSGLPGIERVFSLVDVVSSVPENMRADLLSGAQDAPLGKMTTPDGMRVMIFPGAFQSDDVQAWLEHARTHEEVRIITGVPVLFDELSRLVLRAQSSSLIAAFVLVALMLFVAYRRVIPTLVSLIPMFVTVGTLLGFLAASGIHLNLLTAVASSIVIGVGIDYSIHLVAAIDHARKDGPGFALRGIDAAARPILANALGVAIGLSALFFSPLAPHSHVALIMWVSMTVAALTSLLVIPALSGRDGLRDPAP